MSSLEGKVLAVTRGEATAGEFVRLVTAGGGTPIALQTIEIVPGGAELAGHLLNDLRSGSYDYCAFLSAQAAGVLFSSTDKSEVRQALGRTKVVAVGPSTSKALEGYGIKVDQMPQEYSTIGMCRMLAEVNPAGKRIVIPRSAVANDNLSESLRSLGMVVKEVMLYTVKASAPSNEWYKFTSLLKDHKVDAVVFTSASTVNAFFEILGKLMPEEIELHKFARVISIGPYTTMELRKRKVDVSEAKVHTIAGTVELAKRILK
jgi:uroporphyrinogen-III synthase